MIYVSEHAAAFVSDAARITVLRKYGGIYMDMDALTLRPLPNITNYLGHLDSTVITGAIISLMRNHPLSNVSSTFRRIILNILKHLLSERS